MRHQALAFNNLRYCHVFTAKPPSVNQRGLVAVSFLTNETN